MSKLLECPICLEEMRPPRRIFQCSNGHVICGSCRPRLASCPYCRLRFSEATVTRNILAETTSYDRFLYSAASGRWYVRWRPSPTLSILFREISLKPFFSDILGEESGFLRHPGSLGREVPAKGWEFVDSGEWRRDADLRVQTAVTTSALLCPAVTIVASGAAAAAQPSRLGTFRATGEFSSGRQVFRNTRGQHLLVPAGKNVWSVQSSATATVGAVLLVSDIFLLRGLIYFLQGGGVRSSCAAALCPAHPRNKKNKRQGRGAKHWQYGEADSWCVDPDIVVTCARHRYV